MKFGLRGVIEVNFGLREVTEMMKIENYSDYVWKIMHARTAGMGSNLSARGRNAAHVRIIMRCGPEARAPRSEKFPVLSS